MRSLFAAAPIWIAKKFGGLLGLVNVHAEDESAIAAALALTAQGIQLADAMHLSSRPPGAAFVSFDRSSVRRAKKAGAVGMSSVPPANDSAAFKQNAPYTPAGRRKIGEWNSS